MLNEWFLKISESQQVGDPVGGHVGDDGCTLKPDKADAQAAELIEAKSEILKLRAQLRRTEEERDILKKAARYFASEPE